MARTTLTAKQQRFVQEYLIDLNATQAAIRAGYKPAAAYAMGYENLNKPQIAEAIEKAQGKRSERLELTAGYVLKNLMEIVEVSLLRKAEPGERRNPSAACSALKLLGEHLGLFLPKMADSGNELLAELLRDSIRETLIRRTSSDPAAAEPGGTGSERLATHLANAPAPSAN